MGVEDARFVEGDREPLPRPGLRPRLADVLRDVQRALSADHLSAIRRAPGSHGFEVVCTAAPGFVSAGVALPLDASDLARVSLAGQVASMELDDAQTPLEVLALASGLVLATAVPVHGGPDGVVAGAVVIAWSETHDNSPEVAELVIRREEPRLGALIQQPPGTTRRFAVAHGDPLVAHGLASLAAERLGVDAMICDSVEQLLAIGSHDAPHAIACDELLDEAPLADVAYRLRAAGVTAPLIAVTRSPTSSSVAAALRAGVAGYMSLNQDAEHVAGVIATVLAGRQALPAGPAAEPAPDLTRREHEVLDAFDRGLTDYEIARELEVSVSTVKTHARRVFRKLQVGSRTAAVHRARVEGLL